MNEAEQIQSEANPKNRLQKLLAGALRWGLVGVIAFALGALVITFALYNPTRQKLDVANTALKHADETIDTQADQIITLQTENESLQTKLDSITLHFNVLEALSGLRGASLSVSANDYAGARLLLIQASEALDTLSGRVGADQKDVFIAMQQSAAQALTDVQSNLQSAQPELDQLINNLVQLEDNLFPDP